MNFLAGAMVGSIFGFVMAAFFISGKEESHFNPDCQGFACDLECDCSCHGEGL